MKKQKNKEKRPQGEDRQFMTLTGHLKELRDRLVICVICLIVTSLAGLHFAPDLVELLTDIGRTYGYSYVFLAPQELLMQYFSIALLTGVCLTVPMILYHIWAFVHPGLKKNEDILFLAAIISGLLCFIIGILFAYTIMLPFMLQIGRAHV